MSAKSNTQQPNIVVIMSDEHDPRVSGCYHDPIVETPNLDRMAEEGVVFDGCYTTSPLCVPARLSFTAGKYISRIGGWSNSCALPSADYPSLPRVLQNAGYETYLCGKQHYAPERRYGFGDILPEVGTNRQHKSGIGKRRRVDDAPAPEEETNWPRRSAQFYPADDSGIMSHDRMTTARACTFLEGWAGRSMPPFFLFVGHLAPHFPLIAPADIYEKYRDRVPMPNVPEGLFESLPANYRQLAYGFGFQNADPATVKKGRELYWALVDWYDRQIGQIMTTLRTSGLAENTVVFYTSDHGENKGDHGLWWKNNMFEHAARIPLISWAPDRWQGGQRRQGACSLVDLVQTVADIGGADTPADWDGESMLPWLDDPGSEWRDLAVSEYYGHNIASGITMIRSGPWKYVYHARTDEADAETELYNLDNDPEELCNLAGRPDHRDRISDMHRRLVDELGREPDDVEKQCRADIAKGYQPSG